MKLVQINRSKFVSMNQKYVIEYVIYRGGLGEWIISHQDVSVAYSKNAIGSASTLEGARSLYFSMVKVGA